MAAEIRIVPEEDLKVLRKYIDCGSGWGFILISEEFAKEFEIEDGDRDLDYDFGGEADVWVDWAVNKNDYFIIRLREDKEKA